MNPHLCVCGDPPELHYAHTGACHSCTCGTFLADNGTEPVSGTPCPDHYAGIYLNGKYTLGEAI